MNNEFVNYEQALALKELGFDEPCFGYFENQDMNLVINFNNLPLTEEQSKRPGLHIIDNRNSVLPQWATTAPIFSQAFGWLLEKHNLCGIIIPTVTMAWTFKTMTVVIGMVEVPPYIHVDAYDYSRREEAELACLKRLIEIVKNK